MITDTFLNSCLSLVLNEKSKVKRDRALYRDIVHVLDFYDKKENLSIALNIKTKFECLKKICDLRLDEKTIDNIVDSFSMTEKFKPLLDFLTFKINEDVKDNVTIDNIKQVRLRKKLNSLFVNYDQLTQFLESIEDGSFESIDDAVLDYEDIIRRLYTNMQEDNRGIAIQASSSLDLQKDDFGSVLDLIIKKYERGNTTSTGYPVLDNEVLNGGFEPSRLYIFGGGSGAGKSTLLNNLIINSATKPAFAKPPEEGENPNQVYVYITLENTIEESLLRTYQPIFEKKVTDVIREIQAGVDIKARLKNELDRNNATVIMKYFPAMSISTLDIMSVLDDVIEEYGPGCIKGLYLDYLDLLRTDVKYDLYRLELGHITMSLKSLAVEYNIPVITCTQLGRSVYRVQSARELNLDQMSESIKKVEHADFVALLSKSDTLENRVHMKVGKNRSGQSDIAMDFIVNFDIFKFISGSKVTSDTPTNATTNQNLMGFEGLDSTSF